ncbi:hypothetical protein [Kribbella sp. C-35]|uniref:hypothetical protein n=1 Tax=Kribbella sp. C-35 TaxID=2789276 RepID=UPI0039780488
MDDVVEVQKIFDDMESSQFDVQHRSSLAGDDAKADPYQVSHAVTQQIGVAVDHMHAIHALVRDAGALHNGAPFSLARPAFTGPQVESSVDFGTRDHFMTTD